MMSGAAPGLSSGVTRRSGRRFNATMSRCTAFMFGTVPGASEAASRRMSLGRKPRAPVTRNCPTGRSTIRSVTMPPVIRCCGSSTETVG